LPEAHRDWQAATTGSLSSESRGDNLRRTVTGTEQQCHGCARRATVTAGTVGLTGSLSLRLRPACA
jgi:hypothetical protein